MARNIINKLILSVFVFSNIICIPPGGPRMVRTSQPNNLRIRILSLSSRERYYLKKYWNVVINPDLNDDDLKEAINDLYRNLNDKSIIEEILRVAYDYHYFSNFSNFKRCFERECGYLL